MKICKLCGKAMDDNYALCPYCGTSPDAVPEQKNEQATEQASQPNFNPNQQINYQYAQQNPYGNVPPRQQSAPPRRANIEQKPEIPEYTPAPRPQRSAYVAAFLAIILGMFGVHNFYLDRKSKAIVQLIIGACGAFLTFGIATAAMEVWAVIDAVKLLKGEINTDGTGAPIKMGL